MPPRWADESARDRKDQILHGPYGCPKCGLETLRIRVSKSCTEVIAVCNSCGLKHPLSYAPYLEVVDYYNRLTDEFNKQVN